MRARGQWIMVTTVRLVGLIGAVLALSAQAQPADLPEWAQGGLGAEPALPL